MWNWVKEGILRLYKNACSTIGGAAANSGMSGRVKMKGMVSAFLLLMLCLWTMPQALLPVQAEEAKDRPRLIQTTTMQEEWESLVELDILQVMPTLEENLKKAEQVNLPAVVRIEVGNYLGSGVIFEITKERIIIISNKHLLEHGEGGRVTFYHGVETGGSDIRVSKHYDFGLISVPCSNLKLEQLMSLRRVTFDQECSAQMEQGDELVVIGSKDGPGQNIYEGTLIDAWWYSTDFAAYMLYNNCKAQPGISGGGTFDAHGHYLGMLSAGNGTETLSLPLVTILSEYHSLSDGLENLP